LKQPVWHKFLTTRWVVLLSTFAFGVIGGQWVTAESISEPVLGVILRYALFIPLFLALAWPKGLTFKDSQVRLPKDEIHAMVFRLVIFGGYLALTFAADLIAATAKELAALDTSGVPNPIILALEARAEALSDFALPWMLWGFGLLLASYALWGLIKTFIFVSRIGKDSDGDPEPVLPPVVQPNPNELFIVGDRARD
jgi:hypothetical protein